MIDTVLTVRLNNSFGYLTLKVYEIIAGSKYLAVSVWRGDEYPNIRECELDGVESVKAYVKELTKGEIHYSVNGKGVFEELTANI